MGAAVTRAQPGDEVYFCDGGFGPIPGTYAEAKVLDERYLARKPTRVFRGCRGAAGVKSDLASSLGAELCIDYRGEDAGQRVRAWTGREGADLVHDTVGGNTFTASFSLVRPYGDLVSNVESPWEPEAIKIWRERSLHVSFAWMPAPAVFGWAEARERQRAILESVGRLRLPGAGAQRAAHRRPSGAR